MMLISFGMLGMIFIVPTGRPVGPLSTSTVPTTAPETVPVSSKAGPSNTAVVLFAAIVNGTVREPIENKMAGSSAGRTLFDANPILSEPLTGFGCADDNDNPTGTC